MEALPGSLRWHTGRVHDPIHDPGDAGEPPRLERTEVLGPVPDTESGGSTPPGAAASLLLRDRRDPRPAALAARAARH